MKKPLLLVAVSVLALGSTVAVARQSFSQALQPYWAPEQSLDPRSAWVGGCLFQIETIKAGSSRQDFDRLFEVPGGLSDGKTFSFRQCPYIRVSAEFKGGKVVSLSRPYLDHVYSD